MQGYAAQTRRYQEVQVLSASPGELVVMIYDHLLSNLVKASRALGSSPQELEQRSKALSVSRAAVAELLATLDAEKGGEIAHTLRSLYAFFLMELSTLGVTPDGDRLDRLTRMVQELREAFASALTQTAAVA
ncbi:MAG: flagellar export chaperone FliS [Gemmatimonadota bacterium]